MVGNWNRAVAAGSGELTMCVSQDDELGPGMLAAYVAEFVADPGVVLVSGAEQFIDEAEPAARPQAQRRTPAQRVRAPRPVRARPRGAGAPVAAQRPGFRRAVGGDVPPVGVRRGRRVRPVVRARRRRRLQPPRLGARSVGVPAPSLPATPLARRRPHPLEPRSGAVARDRLRLYERYRDTAGLTERDRAEARSSLASHSLYDAVRAARARQWAVARVAFGNLRTGARAPLRVHAAHVAEIVRHRNRDER